MTVRDDRLTPLGEPYTVRNTESGAIRYVIDCDVPAVVTVTLPPGGDFTVTGKTQGGTIEIHMQDGPPPGLRPA